MRSSRLPTSGNFLRALAGYSRRWPGRVLLQNLKARRKAEGSMPGLCGSCDAAPFCAPPASAARLRAKPTARTTVTASMKQESGSHCTRFPAGERESGSVNSACEYAEGTTAVAGGALAWLTYRREQIKNPRVGVGPWHGKESLPALCEKDCDLPEGATRSRRRRAKRKRITTKSSPRLSATFLRLTRRRSARDRTTGSVLDIC